jgi:hypothetical protein
LQRTDILSLDNVTGDDMCIELDDTPRVAAEKCFYKELTKHIVVKIE